ncbi:MAG: anti-sigma factor [Dehalococcoidia bacterium]
MNCAQVDELLPAFALDAVDAEERAAIEAHLATCDRHAEVAELQSVGLGLAELAPEREPSAALEARLLAAIDADQTTEAPPTPARRQSIASLGWPAIAAVLAILAVALGAWNLMLQRGADASELVYVQRDGEAWMRVETDLGSSQVSLVLGGLERRPETEAFQLWAIRDGRWLDIGTCNTNPEGRWRGEFAFELERSDLVALTIEPTGGSPRPTGPRVFEPPP